MQFYFRGKYFTENTLMSLIWGQQPKLVVCVFRLLDAVLFQGEIFHRKKTVLVGVLLSVSLQTKVGYPYHSCIDLSTQD